MERIPEVGGAPDARVELRRASDLRSCTIAATDGEIGSLDDVYFDDQSWTVRHLVVDTGTWLPGRRVLVPPHAVQAIDLGGRRIRTCLTKQQVEDSPDIDTARPVSRQHESSIYAHYGVPYYWAGAYRWGPVEFPGAGVPGIYPVPPAGVSREVEEMAARARESEDPHLWSAKDVRRYGIKATDGELGHVVDFVLDDRSWAIRYVVADPASWWPGPHVLLSTEWITGVSEDDSTVAVDLDRESVRHAPRFDEHALDREYEARLHAAYRRRGYWERRPESWRMRPPAA